MKYKQVRLTLAAIIIAGMQYVQAQSQSVSIFKNGTAFFSKNIQVDASQRQATLQTIDNVAFGTLWFFTPDNVIKNIRSDSRELASETKTDASSLLDLLKSNLNRRVKLTLYYDQIHEGIIESVKDNLLVFKKITGSWITVLPSDVKQIEFLETPQTQYNAKENRRVIDLTFENANGKQNMEVLYLKQGIAWMPNYALELKDNNKAKLVLKAAIMNDAEDLENASVNFVVGVPNFKFSHLQDPLVSNQLVYEFLNQLNDNAYAQGYGRRNDYAAQTLSNFASAEIDMRESISDILIPDLDGQNAEDLFFYNLSGVNLKRGERGWYQVLETEIDYTDIYQADLQSNEGGDYYSSGGNVNRENSCQVWHSLKLSNKAKLPWTTGSVLITKRINEVQKALGQNKLDYTPVGGSTKIKMSVTPNIIVKESEKETGRVENIKQKSGGYADEVTIEAKIEIQNYRENAIQLSLNRKVIGEMKESSEKWDLFKLADLYKTGNSTNMIEWKVNLEPGKNKEITYTYKIMIAR